MNILSLLLCGILSVAWSSDVSVSNLPNVTTVEELALNGHSVFTVTATDLQNDPLSYLLTSVDPTTSAFVINLDTGEITLSNPSFNYESNVTEYMLHIEVTDGHTSDNGTLTVNITNSVEPPTFTNLPDTVQLREDVTVVNVFFVVTATSTEGGNIKFTCSPTPDDGKFAGSCGGFLGHIRHISSPNFNYATTPVYYMHINATDDGGAISQGVLTIEILNVVNVVPVVTGGLPAQVNVSELTPVNTVIYSNISTFDGDGDPVNIAMTVSPISGSSKFSLDSGTIKLIQSVDYETEPLEYTIMFVACDNQSCSQPSNLTVTITDSYDIPQFSYSPNLVAVSENTGISPPSNLISTSVVTNDTLTYTVVPGAFSSYVSINSANGMLSLIQSVLYADTATFPGHQLMLEVRGTNLGNLSATVNVTVTITEYTVCVPNINGTGLTVSLDPNTAAGSTILTLEAQNCGYNNLSANISGSGSLFSIQVNETSNTTSQIILMLNETLNPTSSTQYTVQITFGDSGVLSHTAVITVTVSTVNTNQPPVFQQSLYKFNIRQDASIGNNVGNILATDANEGDLVRYILLSNSSGAELFYLSYLDGTLATNGVFDGPHTYTLSAYAEDSNGNRSGIVEIEVTVFDATEFLVNWEIDTNGKYLTKADISTFEQELMKTCTPCTPKVVDAYQNTGSINWIMDVYIIKSTDPTSMNFMTKREILDVYTIDGVKTPTAQAANIVSSIGEIVSISEAIQSPPYNWFTDSVAGIVVLTLLVLLGFGLVSTAVVAVVDIAWWSKRPRAKGYHSS